MARLLENISDSEEFKSMFEFMNGLDFNKLVNSSYAKDRMERWFGYYSNLKSIKDKRHELEKDEEIPEVFSRIKNQYYPEADSILLCCGNKPKSDTSIKKHRDHGCFEGKAVMLNFGEAIYREYNYEGEVEEIELKSGDVIEINTKLIHEATQVSNLRLNATLRKVKEEFLPPSMDSALF